MVGREDEREGGRGGEQGRDDEGRGPQCPCHSNLLHTVYLEKLCRAPEIDGPLSHPGQRGGKKGWDRRRQTGGVKLYNTMSYQI